MGIRLLTAKNMNLDLKKKISKSSHQINQVFYTSSERFFNVKYQCFGSLKVCVGNFISKKTPPPPPLDLLMDLHFI